MRARVATAVLWTSVVAAPLHAAILDVPASFPTVGAALAAAAAGDTVRIAPGRYPERGLAVPGGVTLLGGSPDEEAWFDGEYAASTILSIVSGAAPVAIRGITFRNAGAGAVVVDDSAVRHVISGCLFEDNLGTALLGDHCDVVDCTFTGNGGDSAGAVRGTDLRIDGCAFLYNHGNSGGAVWIQAGVVEDSYFAGNRSETTGGALVSNGSTIRNCRFVQNASNWGTPGGGALCSYGGGSVVGCDFVGNHAGLRGGAVSSTGSLSMESCRFVDNDAGTTGGAVFISGGSATLERCSFLANHAPNGGCVYSLAYATIRQCVIAGTEEGLPVEMAGTPPVAIEACNLYGNTHGNWTGPLAGYEYAFDNFSADPLFCPEPRESLFVSFASPLRAVNNGFADIGAAGAACADTGVVVSSRPPGLLLHADGIPFVTPGVFDWPSGSAHTVAAPTFEPAAGVRMEFADWSDGGAATHDVVAVPGTDLRATFMPGFLLAMTADPGGIVEPPTGWVAPGTAVPILASAEPGYLVEGWTGTGFGSYTGPLAQVVVTMTGPTTQHARTRPPDTRQLTMVATEGGWVEPASGPQTRNSQVTITAHPNLGWGFNAWIGTGPGSYSGPGATATVTMSGNIQQTAAFGWRGTTLVETNAVGAGTVSPPLDEYTLSVPLQITATPDSGSAFDRWIGQGPGSYTGPTANIAILPLGPIIQTAYFATGGTYPLTMEATTGGAASPASGNYPPGAQPQISAIPFSGYRFARWEGTGTDSYSGPDAQATVTMHGPITQRAVFEPDSLPHGYEFSVSASDVDPYRNTDAPAGGPRALHLWLTCSQDGISAFECGVLGTLPVLGFAPAPGVFNFGTGSDLQLAISDCPTGENLTRRLGAWAVLDTGGSLCVSGSDANGVFAAVDCGPFPALWWRPRVRGFSSDGTTPCDAGTAGCGDTGTGIATLPDVPGVTGFTAIAPNPFRGGTEVRFGLASPAWTRLAVYDVAGRLIRVLQDDALPAGHHTAQWNGRAQSGPAAGGIYFVRLDAGGVRETRRMVYLGER